MAIRMQRRCWTGAIQALVTGTTVVNRTIAPILELVGAKAVFHGVSIAGVAELHGLERFGPQFRREWVVAACVSAGCREVLLLMFAFWWM